MSNRHKSILSLLGVLPVVIGTVIWLANRPADATSARMTSTDENTLAASSASEDSPGSPMARYLSSRQGPIELYGRVVDQDGNPVEQALVKVNIRSWDGATTSDLLSFTTDHEGRFVIKNYTGDALTIQEINKDGYVGYDSPAGAPRSIAYGAKQEYVPDPSKPLVYRLWRRSENLRPLFRVYHTWKVSPDGKIHTIDLLTKRNSMGEMPHGGDFRITLIRESNGGKRSDGKYNWSVTLETIDGGFVDVGYVNHALWHAPDEGYQPRLAWSYHADDAQWRREVETNVYLRSRNGQVYASGRIRIRPVYAGAEASIAFDGILNPHGSPNLEASSGNLYSDYSSLQQHDPQSPLYKGPRLELEPATRGDANTTRPAGAAD